MEGAQVGTAVAPTVIFAIASDRISNSPVLAAFSSGPHGIGSKYKFSGETFLGLIDFLQGPRSIGNLSTG